MNEHPNSLEDGVLINIAQLIIVQWYLITQQPILKIYGWGIGFRVWGIGFLGFWFEYIVFVFVNG